MGLFDFFKKKNTVTQPRNITSDLGTYEKTAFAITDIAKP